MKQLTAEQKANQHTSGPWQLCPAGICSTPDWTIRSGENWKESMTGALICVMPETTTKTVEEVQSNARLIAAAPELLAACKEGLLWIETPTRPWAATADLMRAAINKATGKA